jgi:putative endonuclease
MNASLSTGAAYEALAARHLESQGLHMLARNVRSRGGELDLVAEHGRTLVFVEVRFRADDEFGDAAASVDRYKQRRLVRAAQLFLSRNPTLAQRPCRFDLVAIDGHAPPRLEWLRDAFRPDRE